MAHLTVSKRTSGPVVILDLEGSLTLGAGSTVLRGAVTELLEGGTRKILLDLTGVNRMDSSGVGELVSAYARTRRFDGELKLSNLAAHVHGLLEMTKLVTVFETFANEADALESFGSELRG